MEPLIQRHFASAWDKTNKQTVRHQPGATDAERLETAWVNSAIKVPLVLQPGGGFSHEGGLVCFG